MSRFFIKKNFTGDNDFSEIDFDLYEELGFSYDEYEDFVQIHNGRFGSADAYPIKIDRMIEALQKLKENGATHVELDYHTDHIGYDISGYEIRVATPEEIDDFLNVEKKKHEKKVKKEELLRQLRELEEMDAQIDDDLPF